MDKDIQQLTPGFAAELGQNALDPLSGNFDSLAALHSVSVPGQYSIFYLCCFRQIQREAGRDKTGDKCICWLWYC